MRGYRKLVYSKKPKQCRQSSDQATGWLVWDSNPGRDKRCFSSPKAPDQLWGPPTLLLNVFQGSCLEVKWPEIQVTNSLPSSAEVMIEWTYTPTPPVCLHGMDRKTLPIHKTYSRSLCDQMFWGTFSSTRTTDIQVFHFPSRCCSSFWQKR